MEQLVNEIFTLIIQITGIIFPVGIAIYGFQYPILREGAKDLPKTAISQYNRLRKKIMRLVWSGMITIFYSIGIKIFILQFMFANCLLWTFLVSGVVLLVINFVFLYKAFLEIGLRNE